LVSEKEFVENEKKRGSLFFCFILFLSFGFTGITLEVKIIFTKKKKK
jgi:hypothetical protein